MNRGDQLSKHYSTVKPRGRRVTEDVGRDDQIQDQIIFLDTMSEFNSSIDSSFVFIGEEQSNVLPPSRPPTLPRTQPFRPAFRHQILP